ncbi:hypothetical protein [Streptomyces chiangmaiensis]|uniref:Cytochrome C oxidase subunit I n=1 Tax=Streptomyces chiangmaiensis TaxID=766497 RepID=A0ABU7FWD5_9ACTN|nr:hypothetical protein [Streptomyces chiangmaiensis]MED7828387.1 hypothetical protein [Streptomyces chiangmaiensis]
MTSSSRHGAPLDRHSGALANEVEGYLLLQAEREQAQREAEALCARLPWLTSGQADDLERHYTEQRLGLTRQALQATADRAKRLRGEYETRYATLRRTLLRRYAICACLLIAGSTTAGAGASLLAR